MAPICSKQRGTESSGVALLTAVLAADARSSLLWVISEALLGTLLIVVIVLVESYPESVALVGDIFPDLLPLTCSACLLRKNYKKQLMTIASDNC